MDTADMFDQLAFDLAANEDRLNLSAAAIRMDISEEALSALVARGEVLSLTTDSGPTFPDWQFKYDGQLYEEMSTLLRLFNGDMDRLHTFMHRPLKERGGRTGVEIMHASKEPNLSAQGAEFLSAPAA
jgi:hypothetical protein